MCVGLYIKKNNNDDDGGNDDDTNKLRQGGWCGDYKTASLSFSCHPCLCLFVVFMLFYSY